MIICLFSKGPKNQHEYGIIGIWLNGKIHKRRRYKNNNNKKTNQQAHFDLYIDIYLKFFFRQSFDPF